MTRSYVRVTLDVNGLDLGGWQRAFATPGLRLGELDYNGGAFLTLGGSPRAVQQAGNVLGFGERVMAEVLATMAGNPTAAHYKCQGVPPDPCGVTVGVYDYAKRKNMAMWQGLCLDCSLKASAATFKARQAMAARVAAALAKARRVKEGLNAGI